MRRIAVGAALVAALLVPSMAAGRGPVIVGQPPATERPGPVVVGEPPSPSPTTAPAITPPPTDTEP